MAKSEKIVRTFVLGRMNKVVDERLVKDGEYTDAMNLRLGSTEESEIGSVENAKGNERLTTLTYTDVANTPLPEDFTKCIGAYEDGGESTIYWFIHCSAFTPTATPSITYKCDLIVSYNTVTQAIVYHVVSINTGGNGDTSLNFNPTYLITGVNLVDNMLFWTDNYNPPRKINVKRNYAYPTTTGVAPALVENEQLTPKELLVIKQPPAQSPIITTQLNDGDEEYLEGRFICFAYRYKYEDGEYSATSQFSEPAFVPDEFQFSPDNYLNEGMVNDINSATIEFNTGDVLVKAIDLLFKEADSSIIKVIEKLNKVENGYLDNQTVPYQFDNSKIFTILPEGEILRTYDNVPRLAKAQTLMGNRLVYGNYVEGYNLINKDGQKVVVSTGYTTELNSIPIEAEDLSVTSTASSYTVDAAGGPQVVPSSVINISGSNLNLIAGSLLSFDFTLTYNSSTDDPATTVAYLNTPTDVVEVTYAFTLPQNYNNLYEVVTSSAFINAIGFGTVANPVQDNNTPLGTENTFSDKWLYAVAHIRALVAAGCPACVPADELIKFQSGIAFDGEGIQIGANAALPDEFSLRFPAIKYIDTNASPPFGVPPAIPNPAYAPVVYKYEYYEVTGMVAAFRAIANPTSLHSNRNYELGIVYMDEFNRSSTALVSENNTVPITCRASANRNQIKVTFDKDYLAPQWASRYKFVIKPDREGYNTIYANISFTETLTNLVYVLVDGENSRKVKEGDELIVKVDMSGALSSCTTVTVLEVKSQPRNFLSPDPTDDTTPGTVGGLIPPAGVYMKINSNSFDPDLPADAFIYLGSRSNTSEEKYVCSKVLYPFWQMESAVPTPIEIPAGSKIRMKIEFIRNGTQDGNALCENREMTIEKTYTASQNYANARLWWNGDQVALSLNDPDIYQNVGGDGCDIANAYNSTNAYSLGITPSMALAALPCDLCTNNFQWYDDSPQGGGPGPGGQVYLLIAGTQSCPNASWRPNTRSKTKVKFEIIKTENVLVFETEPLDSQPDLWYEGTASYGIDAATGAHLGNLTRYSSNIDQVPGTTEGVIYSQFFNCFAFGNGVESYRIKDSMVAKSFNLGNRAYSTSSQDYKEAHRFADLTYSGVINDETNVNKLNEFNLGLLNFKPLEDAFGSVQLLDGRKDDILVLQENKISYVLAGKNLLSDAGGGGALTSTPVVLGNQIARLEEFGISKNPESYTQYGYDKYFTDEKRGAVIQLRGSRFDNEQLTVISQQGMRSWFRDTFVNPIYVDKQKLGGFDPYMNEYVLSINNTALPSTLSLLQCGIQYSVDTSVTPTITYEIELGEAQGIVDTVYQVVGAGDFVVTVVWNGATVATTGVVNTSGTLTWTKNLPYATTAEVTVARDGVSIPIVDVTVSCPTYPTLNVVMITLTNDYQAGDTIHNGFGYTQGGVSSIVTPSFASPPITFASGSAFPLVSQFTTYSAQQGTGSIPIDGTDVIMVVNKLSGDTFQFDPTLKAAPPFPVGTRNDNMRFLRSVTGYTNTPANIATILAASTIGGVVPVTVNQPAYISQFALPGPIAGDGDNEYLYLIYDFRDLNSIELCQVSPTGNDVLDQLNACCDCATCPAGVCTQYMVVWVSGPDTSITYIDCAGVSQSVQFGGTLPFNKQTLCTYPQTGFTVANENTNFTYSITDCAC